MKCHTEIESCAQNGPMLVLRVKITVILLEVAIVSKKKSEALSLWQKRNLKTRSMHQVKKEMMNVFG